MSTRFGVGYSENPKSKECGIEAAQAAMEEAGVSKCNLVMMFTTSKHDTVQLRDGVRSVVGSDAKLIGGYSCGAITRNYLGYEGYQFGVAVMSSDTVDIDMFIETGLKDNEYNVGRALGRKIAAKQYNGEPNLLLFYDGIKRKPLDGEAFLLNLATPLVEGIGEELQEWPRAAGVGMMGDMQGNTTYQWFNDRIEQHSAIGLVLSNGIRMDTLILHGCKPSSSYHTITKAEHNVVLEIDGKPAVEAIADMLGPASSKSWEEYPLFVTLGVNNGDKFGEFKEENYANRLVMGVDKERGGLVMFEPDLTEGSDVQLMRRSLDFDYIRERSNELLDRIGDRNPLFCLYIDCAGRAGAYCGTEREEAEEVQNVIGSRMPLLGMYSGVEIAEIAGQVRPLDWTGVLCVFSE